MEGEARIQATAAAARIPAAMPAMVSFARLDSFAWTTTYEAPQWGQWRDAVASSRPQEEQIRGLGAKAACTSARIRSRASAQTGDESHSSAIASPAYSMSPVTVPIDYSAGPQSGDREPAPGQLALVQAFVNSHYDLEGEHGAELLHSPRALASWLSARGLLDPSRSLSRAELRRALDAREGLRAMLAANNGEEWDAD